MLLLCDSVVDVGDDGSTTVVDAGAGVSVTSFLYEKHPVDPRKEVTTKAATKNLVLFFMSSSKKRTLSG